MQSENTGLK